MEIMQLAFILYVLTLFNHCDSADFTVTINLQDPSILIGMPLEVEVAIVNISGQDRYIYKSNDFVSLMVAQTVNGIVGQFRFYSGLPLPLRKIIRRKVLFPSKGRWVFTRRILYAYDTPERLFLSKPGSYQIKAAYRLSRKRKVQSESLPFNVRAPHTAVDKRVFGLLNSMSPGPTTGDSGGGFFPTRSSYNFCFLQYARNWGRDYDPRVIMWKILEDAELSKSAYAPYIRNALRRYSKKYRHSLTDEEIDLLQIPFRGCHLEDVSQLVFDSSAKLLASLEGQKNIRIWETATGRQLRKFSVADSKFTRIGFTRPGNNFYYLAGRILRVLDLSSSREILMVKSVADQFFPFIVSFRGNRVFCRDTKGAFCSLDIGTGEISPPTKVVSEVAFGSTFGSSPDGTRFGVVKAFSTKVKILSLFEGVKREVWEIQVEPDIIIEKILFSADNHFLALVVDDNSLRLWDVENRAEVRRFPIRDFWGNAVAFSPAKPILVYCGPRGMEFWDIRKSMSIGSLPVLADVSTFSDDGKLLATYNADGIRVWDVSKEVQMSSVEK